MVVACKAADVPKGESKRVELPGRAPIAIFNVDGKYYAIDDTCTHGEASLCEGFLDGTVIECPFHSGTFDVVTGNALTYPATEPVRRYDVRVEGGDVVLNLD
ncbi:MAG TPA: bifunctional 3-phenylpropionate/cinnamic acid dioxygenase ferredoxin subunit [Stellaceae bacterium]|nr:bifunctional 3-phenylpropionate/cinnamic acid dioxygenase ferredoxin subunit [Stellaceae bacterium]